MFGFGMGELIVVFLIVLLLFGASRLPEIARALGKSIKELKDVGKDVRNSIEDVIKDLVINEDKSLLEIYGTFLRSNEVKWSDKNNIAMVYYRVMYNKHRTSIIDEIDNFLGGSTRTISTQYQSWLKQEYGVREKNMELLSELLNLQDQLTSDDIDNLPKSTVFIISSSKIIYSIAIDDNDDGIKLFDRMKLSIGIPYIYYRESETNVYSKIFRPRSSSVEIQHHHKLNMIVLDEIKTASPGKIYMTIWTEKGSRASYTNAVYTVKTHTLEIAVQEVWKEKIEQLLRTTFNTDVIMIDQYKIEGTFSLRQADLSNASFLDVMLNNQIVNKYLYVGELDTPQSLKNNFKIRFTSPMGKANGYVDASGKLIEKRKMVLDTNIKSTFAKAKSKIKIPIVTIDERSGKTTYETEEYAIPESMNLISFRITDSDSIDVIEAFIETSKRIIALYDYQQLDLYAQYKFLVNEKTPEEVEFIQETRFGKKEKRVGGKKLRTLRAFDEVLFSTGYAKVCSPNRQPILLQTEEEAKEKESQGFYVLRFPNYNNTETFFFQGDKDAGYPYVGVIKNPSVEIEESITKYPYVPCSFTTPQDKSKDMRDWKSGEISAISARPRPKDIITHKILPPGRYGALPPIIEKLARIGDESLDDKDIIYGRIGVTKSASSFLQCLLVALDIFTSGETEYGRLDIDKEIRFQYVESLRKAVAQQVHPGLLKQELYDYDEKEISNQLGDINVFLDPAIHYRAFEELFDITIFVFTRKEKKHYLEIPRYELFHVRPFENRQVIFIYKHMGGQSEKLTMPQCELIYYERIEKPKKEISRAESRRRRVQKTQKIHEIRVSSKKLRRITVFDDTHKIRELYKKIIALHTTYTWSLDKQDFILRQNLFSKINFFKDTLLSQATGQYIDRYGKARGFLTTVNSIDIFIAVPPTQPENISMIDILEFNLPRPNVRSVMEIFDFTSPSGFTYSIDNDRNTTGVWFPLSGIEFGIYVYTSGMYVPIDVFTDVPADPLGLSVNDQSKDVEDKINIQRLMIKTLDILLQFINWIYTIHLIQHPEENLDDFVAQWIQHGNENEGEYDISGVDKYSILPSNFSVLEAIRYTSNAVNGLVKNGKLYMYNETFGNRIKYQLKERFSMITPTEPPDRLVGLWDSSDMFAQQRDVVVIIGDKNLRSWVTDENRKTRLKIMITDTITIKDYRDRKEPYLYKDTTDNIYLVQNVNNLNSARDRMKHALHIAYEWYVKTVNIRNSSQYSITDQQLSSIDRVIYTLSTSRKIQAIETRISAESKGFLQILQYPDSVGTYAALLPIR